MKKPPLIEALKINLRGNGPEERLAGLIVVSLELRHVKFRLGYSVGCREAYRGEGRPTWEALLDAQAGITDATERNLYKCAAAVKARLAASEESEAREILAMMETPPSKLSDAERQQLVDGIRRYALKDGDTQEILKKEFCEAAAKTDSDAPQPSTAACGEQEARELKLGRMVARMIDAAPRPEDSEECGDQNITALAMSFGLGEKRAREVARAFRARELAGLAMRALRNKQNGGGL